jgi:ATP-binding cassette subfamily B protein/ATP-binding cassette subfamily C protein
VRITAWRRRERRPGPGGAAAADPADPAADETTAELEVGYWRTYHQRMATIGFLAMACQFPRLIAQAVRLGSQASRRDIWAAIVFNLGSGLFTGYALLATTGVLEALLAAGPTPARVRAAIPALALVAAAVAARAGLQVAGGWAQARLQPQVDRLVEMRLLDLTTQVGLAAYDDADFHEAMMRARERGLYAAPQVVANVINCVTGLAGIGSTAVVVAVLHPVLLALLVLAELPGGWAAVRAARIGYATRFALVDAYRRKYILTDLMAERRTAAELRSFTLRDFLLSRAGRLAAHARDVQLAGARRQALTRLTASAAGGVATAGVYVALGLLLAAGAVPVAVAGTAVLAIRSAQASLASLLYAVNQCYEEGLYFSDYLDFIADASGRVPPAGGTPAPAAFGQISADGVTFSYPGADEPALREVSVTIRRGEVVALVGENGSGKTTLAKVLAGLYAPQAGTVRWDQAPIAGMDLAGLRERIAVIAQDHANWPLTARSNITMGRPDDAARLAEAVSLSGADTVIDALPRGLDTLLDRQFVGGAELSGGQWQRVAVARGFYRAAPLLIMDEPTAALDARAEYALFASVRQKTPGRSILIITHRLASVRHCDRIYVLDGGRVVEQGSHAELVALGGQYAELYALQASQYEPTVPAPRTPPA